MKKIRKTVMLGMGAAMLWTAFTTGVQGFSGTTGKIGSGIGKGWVQMHGHVLCAGCTLEDLKSGLRSPASLYQLNHRQGQVVMEVNSTNVDLPYRRLWLKGGDQLFATLSAEENLFREIEVSGLLREYLPTAGTLDLATVQILGEEQKPTS